VGRQVYMQKVRYGTGVLLHVRIILLQIKLVKSIKSKNIHRMAVENVDLVRLARSIY